MLQCWLDLLVHEALLKPELRFKGIPLYWGENRLGYRVSELVPVPVVAESGITIHDGMGRMPMLNVVHPING